MSGDWYDPTSMDYAEQLFRRLPAPPAGDQIVVLHNVPWEQYDALCRASEGGRKDRIDSKSWCVGDSRACKTKEELPHLRLADA